MGIILLYLPLYAYRRYVEDQRANDPRAGEEISWNGPLTGMDVGHCRCQRQA